MEEKIYDVYSGDVKMNEELLTNDEAENLVLDLLVKGLKNLYVVDTTSEE